MNTQHNGKQCRKHKIYPFTVINQEGIERMEYLCVKCGYEEIKNE